MAKSKVNFSADHKAELNKLFLSLSFAGHVLTGKFGANALNPYDMLHHASISTLKSLYNQLKKEISAAEDTEDDWTSSSYEQSQLALKKRWKQFIHLVIGYKKAEAEKAENRAAVKQMKAKLTELKESNKTPEEKIKELEASIAEMEGDDSDD